MDERLAFFKVSPYGRIQYVTRLDQEVAAYIVCKGGLEVSEGKRFTKSSEATAYARGLVDGGWCGPVTIRYEYA